MSVETSAGGGPRRGLRPASALALGLALVGAGCGSSGLPGGSVPPMPATAAADTPTEDTRLVVRLDALERPRPEPELQPRNPFRFGSRRVTAGPDVVRPDAPVAAPVEPVAPPVVTRRPPIRMIGVVDAPAPVGRVAVLTDGDVVFHGRIGEIVDGRYRVLGVGPNWVQLQPIDGGPVQMIRLPGS